MFQRSVYSVAAITKSICIATIMIVSLCAFHVVDVRLCASPPRAESRYRFAFWLEEESIRNLHTWEATLSKVDAARAELVRGLIDAAQDQERPLEERREVIFMLGRIGTSEAREFLIDHVALRMLTPMNSSDVDIVREFPCMYALAESDWGAAQAVLSSLKAEKSTAHLRKLGYALKATLGKRRAALIVDEDLRLAADPILRSNLAQMSKYLHNRQRVSGG